MEPEIKELLQERAGEVRLGPELPAKVLRRARRRRGLTAAVATTTALVVVAGTVVGLQVAFGNRAGPGATTPAPTPSAAPSPSAEPGPAVQGFPGLWPGAGRETLREWYVAGSTWLVDPERTAVEFARQVVGWPSDRVGVRDVSTVADTSTVALWDTDASARFAPEVALSVELQRFGGMDPQLWDVVRVESGLLHVTCPSPRQNVIPAFGPVGICGELSQPPAGWVVTGMVEDAASELNGSDARSRAEIPVTGSSFHGSVPLTSSYMGEDVSLAITVVSGSGHVLGMFVERLGVDLASPSPTTSPGPSQAGLSAPAAAKRDAIRAAARAGDFSALGALVDPAEFHFRVAGASPGSDVGAQAVAYWKRRGPAILRIAAALLAMPYAERSPGSEADTYVWPAVATMTPAELARIASHSPEWRRALERIYPDVAGRVRHWVSSGHYTGWRIEIRADGRWISFLEGS